MTVTNNNFKFGPRPFVLSRQERIFRVLLAIVLGIIVYRSDITAQASDLIIPFAALVIGIAAIGTAIVGNCSGFLGIHKDHALALFAARLFVGWSFFACGMGEISR